VERGFGLERETKNRTVFFIQKPEKAKTGAGPLLGFYT
jgi:hypothetical protein